MIQTIHIGHLLRETVASPYRNLVTRPTGAAIRNRIQETMADSDCLTALLDFSGIELLDFSCADEVVAKLLLRYVAAERADREAYFLFRGVTDDHWDAIETVLERHSLALVLETDDGARVVGMVDDGERVAWEKVYELGRTGPADLATALGGQESDAEAVLDALHRRRLVMRTDEGYIAVGGIGIRHG